MNIHLPIREFGKTDTINIQAGNKTQLEVLKHTWGSTSVWNPFGFKAQGRERLQIFPVDVGQTRRSQQAMVAQEGGTGGSFLGGLRSTASLQRQRLTAMLLLLVLQPEPEPRRRSFKSPSWSIKEDSLPRAQERGATASENGRKRPHPRPPGAAGRPSREPEKPGGSRQSCLFLHLQLCARINNCCYSPAVGVKFS